MNSGRNDKAKDGWECIHIESYQVLQPQDFLRDRWEQRQMGAETGGSQNAKKPELEVPAQTQKRQNSPTMQFLYDIHCHWPKLTGITLPLYQPIPLQLVSLHPLHPQIWLTTQWQKWQPMVIPRWKMMHQLQHTMHTTPSKLLPLPWSKQTYNKNNDHDHHQYMEDNQFAHRNGTNTEN